MSAWISGWQPTLTALIGLERELQGKSAGIRTQTIVGTAAALILLVSKYGFSDVLVRRYRRGRPVTRRGPNRFRHRVSRGGHHHLPARSVHGLTTAAAIWESAAIGMAAGAGLLLLACTVTAMHFLVVVGFMPLSGGGILTAPTVLAGIDGVMAIRQLRRGPRLAVLPVPRAECVGRKHAGGAHAVPE